MKLNTVSTLLYTAVLALALSVSSCEKNLDVELETGPEALTPENAIKSKDDLQKLLNSCYDACANMMNGQFQVSSDLLADDVSKPTNNDGFITGIYNRQSDQFNTFIGRAFAQPYFTIYRCNVMDLYYDKVEISDAEKNRLQGEAAFLRALCHFEAVKLWAHPYGFTPDNSHLGIIIRKRALNEAIPRSTVKETYDYIISELQSAIGKLPEQNGVYATKNAAKALLAKVYFQMNDYTNALTLLDEVINTGGYQLSDSLNRFVRENSVNEVVFGFVSGNNAYETGSRSGEFKDKYRNDLQGDNVLPVLCLSAELAGILKSDTTDQRGKLTRTYNKGQPNEQMATTKFNLNNFATPYLHLTDLKLMRAEILAIQGNASSAISDLTPIIKRAYLPSTSKETYVATLSGNALVEEIRLQRRIELNCEGDRLHQVKRIGVSKGQNNLMVRGVPWNCNGMILQFPASCGTSRVFEFNPTTICN
jgi:tetratricopeptide (TPR) repeat protein